MSPLSLPIMKMAKGRKRNRLIAVHDSKNNNSNRYIVQKQHPSSHGTRRRRGEGGWGMAEGLHLQNSRCCKMSIFPDNALCQA